jgi:hypothetical protein
MPSFIPATFLNGDSSNMNTMPMLKIWTPPPDMYSINACIGRAFAGAIATSQARFSFRESCDAAVAVVFFTFDWIERKRFLVPVKYDISFYTLTTDDVAFSNPGGGARFRHLAKIDI